MKNAALSESLVDHVVRHIQTEIAQNRLRPNEKISENPIAKQLHISRSPIREAFRMLERDGLIRLVPGQGAHVSEVTPEDACEIFLLRSYLIGLAVRLASLELTPKNLWKYKNWVKQLRRAAAQKHGARFLEITSAVEKFFTRHSGSARLTRFIEMLGNPCLRYRAFLTSVPGYMSEVAALHADIATAIEKHDAEKAESLRREISEKGRNLIYQYFLTHGKARERKLARS
jgi:DNA-binding GntR family transcriptional regulator